MSKIYRLLNDEDFLDKNGKPVPFLTYETPTPGIDSVISTGGDDATLEELVELCDHQAENMNAHDFCGTHRLLGAVLYRKLGRKLATEVMLEIARREGLQGMSGICSKTNSYSELGVGKMGRDWHGSYGS